MSKRAMQGLLLGIFLAVTGGIAAEPQPPHEVEDFIREDRFDEVAVSRKGTYVAVTVPEADRTVLYVFRTGEARPLTRVQAGSRRGHIVDIFWANDDRLIYSTAVKNQMDEVPVLTGDTWAIDADGRRRMQLAHRASIVDTQNAEDDDVLAIWPDRNDETTTLYRLNVRTGHAARVVEAPVRSGWFSVDPLGQPRFAGERDIDRYSSLYYLAPGASEWKLINDESTSQKTVLPVGYSADGSIAYLQSEHATGPDSIEAFEIATGARRTVSRDTLADPAMMINAIGKPDIIGVLYARSGPRYEYFDPDSPDARAHRALTMAFPGQIVRASTYATAGREALVYVYGDREPGAYYAMHLGTRRVSPMMFRADWIDPQRLGAMREITFKARDGRTIPALLTIPAGSDGRNLPMVVHPHGGPFGIVDRWAYDPTVQAMASHGYAVLQVNFRGSGGYGRDHLLSGYKQWGLAMQDDLTDATHWAIGQGIADRQRICIFGASYGGYAALMGAAREPDLYRCAVGQVGVYNLQRIMDDDSRKSDKVRRYLEVRLNYRDDGLQSPDRIANRIRIPVFLSAGHEDEIAPVEHTEMMEAALRKAGVPVETLYFRNEGHGVYDPENKRRFYGQLLDFLHRHIGGRAPVVATPEKK